ncbi:MULTISPECIES: phosphate ABC transporter permease PstA [unclassified Halorubrum]|uniref:phosphate ABC transporter permease PstA n=1 Tax=unclassified Halorubrum TaxID=2642239 RepID=UPI000B98D1EC|nr:MULTISPECIES: phosphate ABC transporter permease PstA [unclassified Halorubrum]OYR42444.1 phosphate ABC transporter, permease protein PstA [Halorubrum sp. Eb13]OYR56344.1 phosphate ABC transporter, permease protein PstA [Halorubrum sp. Ea1]
MATDTDTGRVEEFGEVSRVRGIAFEYLSLGASVLGIFALAVLLIYVTIDAFDLANANPLWLLTYFLTLVVPFLGFCLYSARDRTLTRRAVTVAGGGLVAVAVAFTLVETFVGQVPRLNWQLTYLFVVIIPLTGYLVYMGARGRPGSVGFGMVGRLIGGTAIGLAFSVLFLVFDERLWFLAYTLGIVPALLAYAYGRLQDTPAAVTAALPISILGMVLAVFVREVLRTYPTTAFIYLWTLAIPIAAAGAVVVNGRGSRTAALTAGGVPLALATAVGLFGRAAGLGVGGPNALLVIAVTGVPVAAYLHRVFDVGEGVSGLGLPVLLVAGALAGAFLVELFGIPTPSPWVSETFLTEAPSRTATEAGLYPAIVGSVIIIAMVAVLSFALGVATSVFLEEYTADTGVVGALTRLLQINIANLAAVPSVVYGLLGLGLFANLLGFGFGTAVTVSLTLSLLILPITIISAQEAIRSVPDDLRRGSDAMGATRWQTTKNVVLPEAFPGILTGTILALGRAIGETAPLIMVGAATTVFSAPSSLFSKFSAMPMQIYAWANFPQAEFRYGVVAAGVITLLIILIGMNGTAILLRNRAERGS